MLFQDSYHSTVAEVVRLAISVILVVRVVAVVGSVVEALALMQFLVELR